MIKLALPYEGQDELTTINEGLLWKHPLESRYGVARRLLSANPRIALANVKRILDATHPRLQPVDAMDALVPWGSVRQCPECAQHLFHPSIFQLPALTTCPIHRCPLTLFCPDCRQAWDRPLKQRRPCCPTCGCLPCRRWGQTRLRQTHYRAIGWLTRWLAKAESRRLSLNHPSLFDIQMLTDRRSDIERPRFYGPQPSRFLYVAFESQRAEGSARECVERLGLRYKADPLKTRASKLRQWQPVRFEPFDGSILGSMKATRSLSNESPMVSLLTLALRRILRWQASTLNRGHSPVWVDLRALRPEAIREGKAPCPLCMAFSFWCRAVTLKFAFEGLGGTPGEHELCRFADFVHYPNMPEGVFIRDELGLTYRPSRNFERWLFLRASDLAFVEFVQLAFFLTRETSKKRVGFRQTGYRPGVPRFRFLDEISQLLEISQQGERLTALFWPGSSLSRLTVSANEIQLIKECHKRETSDDNPIIWSLPSNPKQVTTMHAKQLLRVPISRPGLRPLLYPWLQQTPSLKANALDNPYDSRAVIGESDFGESLNGAHAEED